MIDPTRVLPSNAPPLRNDENAFQVQKVLQEHSGNRRHNDFVFGDTDDPKFPSSDLNENGTLGSFHLKPAPLQLYHPQPQHRNVWRHTYARASGLRHPTAEEEEARIEIEAERLRSRFQNSENYTKYRAKYGVDRDSDEDKPKQNQKGRQDQKWPDHMEKAFFNGGCPRECMMKHY